MYFNCEIEFLLKIIKYYYLYLIYTVKNVKYIL